MINVFKRNLRIIIVLAILSIFTCIYLLSDFNVMFTNERFVQVSNDIKNVKDDEELESIVSLYNKIHKEKEKYCPCKQATHYINNYSVFKPSISRTIYNLKLHKDYEDDSCLKFLLLNQCFSYGVVGVKEASKYYYKKALSEINEEQIITLIVMFENPSFYHPYRNKEKVQEKVKRYQNLISNK